MLFYQILLAGKYSGPTIGLAKNLLKAGSRETALGAVTGKKLPIRFSHKFGAVRRCAGPVSQYPSRAPIPVLLNSVCHLTPYTSIARAQK